MNKEDIKRNNSNDGSRDELPTPIQLTPDQLKEVAGGVVQAATTVIRKGIPQVME